MRRRQLLAHLRSHGCNLVREGGKHSWWGDPEKIADLLCPDTRKFTIIWHEKSVVTWAFHNPDVESLEQDARQ